MSLMYFAPEMRSRGNETGIEQDGSVVYKTGITYLVFGKEC